MAQIKLPTAVKEKLNILQLAVNELAKEDVKTKPQFFAELQVTRELFEELYLLVLLDN